MDNPIVTHAKHNVWCATNQDFQHHINLPRITPDRGVLRGYPVLWDQLLVPKIGKGRDYFHFYQVGNLPAKTFDFIGKENEWISYLDLNHDNNILMDIYFISGAIVPRDHIWITRLYNNNIVIAIRNNLRIDYGICDKEYYNGVSYKDKFTLDNDRLIVRFYSNAYFDSIKYIETAIDPKQPIRHVYRQITNQEDFTQFMIQASSIETEFGKSGFGVYYNDGFITEKPTGFSNAYLGRHLGFTWDESFKKNLYFDIKNLPSFISTKHRGVRKYLLVTSDKYDKIDYHDDVDFYIVNKSTGQGVYYNRNASFGLSQITHNTYALSAEAVERYIELHEFLDSIDNCTIRVMIRQGGRDVGLLNQKNRIEELYNLDYSSIVNTHINTQSLVPSWRASNLEASAYVSLMSAPSHLITTNLVVDAYGYNGIVTQFANPQVKVNAGDVIAPTIAMVPDKKNAVGVRSLFTYDAGGLMSGYFANNSLSPLITLPNALSKAKKVECLNFELTEDKVSAWINVDVTNNEIEQYGFRCYVSAGDLNGISGNWEDVTGSKFYTYIKATSRTPATIKWRWDLLSQTNLYPCVKSNKHLHIYKWSKQAGDKYDGCLELVVKATQNWGGVMTRRALDIPPSNVDVFVNGLSLIENVDYFMHWPTIVIVNKAINALPVIDVVVRSYGFGDPRTNTPFKAKETGFIKGGALSINGVYDVRNNKCVRVIVDNKLVSVNDVNYGERSDGVNQMDGKPYAITDYVLPVENLLNRDTWSLYEETLRIDESVSNYLTPRVPEKPIKQPIINVTRWPVISPMVSSILYAFVSNYDFDNIVPDNYTNEDIEKWLKPFKWLLPFDPAHLNVDENYFRIEPHANSKVIVISQKQYEFLEWVIKLYLNGRVDLTDNVRIGK